MQAPTSPNGAKQGTSPRVLALTNLGSLMIGALASTGLYFADVVGNNATTKAVTKVALAKVQAERATLEIKTAAEAEEFRIRSAALSQLLEGERAACHNVVQGIRDGHREELRRSQDAYNVSLQLIAKQKRKK